MNNFLDEIIIHKRKEVEMKKEKVSEKELIERMKLSISSNRDFKKAILHPQKSAVGIIAEMKLASPSAGRLGNQADVKTRLQSYVEAGADGLSMVVDAKYFGGSLDMLALAKESTTLPVLCKDFILDAYQIYEVKQYGANAVLLIAKILHGDQLENFVEISLELGIEPIVEIQTEQELDLALKTNCRCIAVNARNLNNFIVDIDQACCLIQHIPAGKVPLGFSGVKTVQEVTKYKTAGAKAVLVGTSAMQSQDVVAFFRRLRV